MTAKKVLMVSEIENRRQDMVKSSVDDTMFLSALNDRLAAFEAGRNATDGAEWPHIWVIGLPRSGSTLLMQLICAGLKVGYINNLIARFWRAPQTGMRLSNILLGDARPGRFSSHYGSASELSGPHEFSYFWLDRLGVDDFDAFSPSRCEREMDWLPLRDELNSIGRVSGMPMVYKALYPAFFGARFAAMFPKSIFVTLRRDPLDVAASLVIAREKYYGERSRWWSMYPEDYKKYLDLPYWRQIPIQLRELEAVWFGGLDTVANERIVNVNYADLCRNPSNEVSRIRMAFEAVSGKELPMLGKLPGEFSVEAPKVNNETLAQLTQGLALEYPNLKK